MELCRQVVSVADALCGPSGDPLARAAVISSRNPPPRSPVDIAVSTPAAMDTLLAEFGGSYGRQWTPGGLAQTVRHFVADEADALVSSDSYWEPLSRILDVWPACLVPI
jgi:hypothetical protein